MKTIEIELHESGIVGGRIVASYTMFDGELAIEDCNKEIHKGEVLAFVDRMGLNDYCVDELTGEYAKYDAETYLQENLNDIVQQYLESIQ